MQDERTALDDIREQTRWAATQLKLAEERTLSAAERTYASWLRAGLAAFAVGIGFQIFLGHVKPAWLPKTVASLLIFLGVGLFWLGFLGTQRSYARLHSHVIPIQPIRLLMAVTIAFTSIGLATAAILWIA